MKYLALFACAALLSAAGCGTGDPGVGGEKQNTEILGPGGEDGTVDYPAGPYGYAKGATVENLTFFWHKNGARDVGKEPERVRLSDFYALRKSGARLLFLSGAAEWCDPCKVEADLLARILGENQDLKSFLEAEGGPQALQVVQVVMQNQDRTTSTKATIDRWATAHKANFGVGIDPRMEVFKFVPRGVFPTTLYIKLADMKLLAQEGGTPDTEGAFVDRLKSFLKQARP